MLQWRNSSQLYNKTSGVYYVMVALCITGSCTQNVSGLFIRIWYYLQPENTSKASTSYELKYV